MAVYRLIREAVYTDPIRGGRKAFHPEDAPAIGALMVETLPPDPDGDLTVLLDNGNLEAIHPSCLERVTGPEAVLRDSLWRHAQEVCDPDDFAALAYYRDALNDLQRRRERARKVCADCGHSKPLSDYHVKAESPDGLQSLCRECVIRRNAERYRAKHGSGH